MAPPIPALLITGPIGAGKTAVASEVSELLSGANVAHAMVDVDSLRECHPSPPHDPYNVELAMRNLAAVWRNYRAAGAGRLILADVLETREDLGRYREVVPGVSIQVVRLRAAPETLASRVRRRELGSALERHARRAAELAAQMERTRVEDVLVDTDGKPVTEVAREVLVRTGWPGAEQTSAP